MEWREYQEQAANFFRKLGFTAYVEHEIEGVRGLHSVDVYVEGYIHGIPFKWIIECKAWKSNIPKEKVMALSSIVQDIGADRGFLLSETGFQSGAIRAAYKMNVTLSSLDDLADITEEYCLDSVIGRLNWRLQKARNRLREIKREKYKDEYYPPMLKELGELSVLESVLEDAAKNEYQIIYRTGYQIESIDEMIIAADKVINEADQWTPEG